MCRGCSHWTYYDSWDSMWVHEAFAVDPTTGKVLMCLVRLQKTILLFRVLKSYDAMKNFLKTAKFMPMS